MNSKIVEAVCEANIKRSKIVAAYLSRWLAEGKLPPYECISSSGINVGSEGFPPAFLDNCAALTEQALTEADLTYSRARRKFARTDGVLYLPVDGKVRDALSDDALSDNGIVVRSLVDIMGEEDNTDRSHSSIDSYRAYRDMVARHEDDIISFLLNSSQTYHL